MSLLYLPLPLILSPPLHTPPSPLQLITYEPAAPPLDPVVRSPAVGFVPLTSPIAFLINDSNRPSLVPSRRVGRNRPKSPPPCLQQRKTSGTRVRRRGSSKAVSSDRILLLLRPRPAAFTQPSTSRTYPSESPARTSTDRAPRPA